MLWTRRGHHFQEINNMDARGVRPWVMYAATFEPRARDR